MRKLCALFIAGIVTLTGCSSQQNVQETSETSLSADVVVVGSGIGGMSAAISAAQNDASVILVEKQAYLGGSYFASPGNMAVAEIEENKENHIQESNDTLSEAIDRYEARISDTKTSESYDRDRVETLLVESMNTVKWQMDMGIEFAPALSSDVNGLETLKPNVPEIEKGLNGAKCMKKMSEIATGLNANLMTSTEATSLIVEDGVVKGITAKTSDGESITINAKQVILATGGFGANAEMLISEVPVLENTGYYYQGLGSNTGDGIRMAKEAGAALYEDPWVVATTMAPAADLLKANTQFGKLVEGMVYTVAVQGDAIEGASIADHLVVNAKGERIVNEAGNKSVQLAQLLDSDTAPYYALYTGVDGELLEILTSGIETGLVIKANTLEELANTSGMDATTLANTVTRYNDAVANGVDEDFNKPIERMHAIATEGDLYLVRVVPSFVATMGGVITNDNYQVINANSEAIQGLYAVGETAHNFLYTRNFVAGASNGFSATMGRLAGAHAAKACQ